MGSQEYMNAFNRAQALMGTRLGALGSLYGGGMAAAQQVGQQAGQYGTNVGNLLMQGGQARASGYLGQANALSQALGQGAMGYGLYKGGYFDRVGGGGGGSNLMALNYMGPRVPGQV
jgi:PPE-repeat protein